MRLPRIAVLVHPAYAAAFCAFAVGGLYLAVIAQQGNGGSRVAFVAASLAAAGVAAAASAGSDALPASLAAAWAVTTLWIWVVLGLASIGILIVPAAVPATVALTHRQAPAAAVAAGMALGFLTAVAGLAWTPA
jgi:hypothetical protein